MKMPLILAPKIPMTLLDICVARTSALLRDGYYQQHSGTRNPFEFTSLGVTDTLFEVLIAAKKDACTKRVEILRPLLTSGRIRSLDFRVLDHNRLEVEDVSEILGAVVGVPNVRTLCVQSSDFDGRDIRPYDTSFIPMLKDFVSKCTDVVYLEIPSEAFDAQVLLQHPSLRKLTVDFVSKLEMSRINDSFVHRNLTEICINPMCEDLPESMAKILQCCPNLVKVYTDISGALELLHGREFHDGQLHKRYKLQSYRLHFPDSEPNSVLPIASVVCPLTRHLSIEFSKDTIPGIEGLANFAKLRTLSVDNYEEYSWPLDDVFVDFHSGLGDALKRYGASLRSLSLSAVKLDLEAIGISCPNLTDLSVFWAQFYDIVNPSEEYFVKMEYLSLECKIDDKDANSPMQFLLSSCKELQKLYLSNAECLTDELLDSLLQKNSLPCLKDVDISECYLTRKGIHLLLERCRSLESIEIASELIPTSEEVELIVRSFNPNAHRACSDPVARMLDSFPTTKWNESGFIR